MNRETYAINFRKSLLCTAMVIAFTVPLFGGGQRPKTVEELLQADGIALTKSALLEALNDPRPAVRSRAAAALSDQHASDAAPAISDALSREQVFGTRVELAHSLLLLESKDGANALKAQCNQLDAPAALRMRAAMYLLESGDQSCSDGIIDVVESTSDADARLVAIGLLPKLRPPLPKELTTRITSDLTTALRDPISAVRIEAAHAIVQLKDRSYVPLLQDAARNEEDKTVRSEMNTAIRHLENQPQ